MQLLNQLQLSECKQLAATLAEGKSPVAVSGLSAVHRAHFMGWLNQYKTRVLLCSDEFEGHRLQKDLTSLTGQAVPLLTARTLVFHKMDTQSRQWEHKRLAVLHALQTGQLPLVVATIEGALQYTLPPETLQKATITLTIGDQISITALTDQLVKSGYVRAHQVEGVGQFSVRGGIFDIYPPNRNSPVRLDFFGDELDSMGEFDVLSQRRTENIEQIHLLPATEVLVHHAPDGTAGLAQRLQNPPSGAVYAKNQQADGDLLEKQEGIPTPDRYLPLIYPEKSNFLSYLPTDALIGFSECNRISDRAKTSADQWEEDVKLLLERGDLSPNCCEFSQSYPKFLQQLKDRAVVYFESFTLSTYPLPPKAIISVVAKQIPPFGANLTTALEDIQGYLGDWALVVALSNQSRAKALLEVLNEANITATLNFDLTATPKSGEIVLTVGGLSGGVEYPSLKFALLVEGQPTTKREPTQKKVTNRQKLKSYADLGVGDLVVHEQHGIGRYMGMEKITTDGVAKDYIKLAYAGTDTLFVPATQLDLVSKYIGGGEDAQQSKKLSKLGGGRWEKTKATAKKAVADLAEGLIKLHAQRRRQKGFAFSPDTPWQQEFEELFPYAETDDQLRSSAEIKRDMEDSMPMDRLLCGDVGFGKTEVAFRAMMKCVQDGKQTAILVPTTVLARQHYLTSLKRFEQYPVNIDVVSRFRTPAQMKITMEKLAGGEIDILIGTHRLFQKDIVFKDLGLLVVDEEQRFGVAHKERLKEKFSQVDVLTLSATPIPRTLNMALSGLRDMSTLEEPPANRQPVQTFVLEEDMGVICEAITRERERNGQVIYLHNRVDTIARRARKLTELLGDEVRIAVAHGKMTSDEIHNVMTDMTDGEIDILVCTTIIETGVDLPNANTLIISDADKLGLSQLHQIRGRVGRSNRRAYAYLTYQEGKVLSEVATKRLSALREFAEFGSGFKIAMRDLEIRGAGNVIGPEQSGFMVSVGYDLYLKMLEEAVLTAQGVPLPKKKECLVDLAVSASVPDRYVPMAEQRMDLYRQIASIETPEHRDDLIDELIDRYGEPPVTVNNLIAVAMLRTLASDCKLSSIVQKGDMIRFYVTKFDFALISDLCSRKEYLKKLTFSAGERPYLVLRIPKQADVLQIATNLLTLMYQLETKAQPQELPTQD